MVHNLEHVTHENLLGSDAGLRQVGQALAHVLVAAGEQLRDGELVRQWEHQVELVEGGGGV